VIYLLGTSSPFVIRRREFRQHEKKRRDSYEPGDSKQPRDQWGHCSNLVDGRAGKGAPGRARRENISAWNDPVNTRQQNIARHKPDHTKKKGCNPPIPLAIEARLARLLDRTTASAQRTLELTIADDPGLSLVS
jgi:hypothetical protein